MRLLPTAASVLLSLVILDPLVCLLTERLADFEVHNDKNAREYSYCLKTFLLRFVNIFGSPLYAALHQRCTAKLTHQLVVLLLAGFAFTCLHYVRELLSLRSKKAKDAKNSMMSSSEIKKSPSPTNKAARARASSSVTSASPATATATKTSTAAADQLAEEVARAKSRNGGDVTRSLLSMAMEFGFISMFSFVFPFGRLFAVLCALFVHVAEKRKLKPNFESLHEYIFISLPAISFVNLPSGISI
jgi:hypothetical protein